MKRLVLYLPASALIGAVCLFASCKPGGEEEEFILEVPQNVTANGSTVTSLTFSWDAVPGAESYDCRIQSLDGTVAPPVSTVSATRITFDQLTPGLACKFAVQAVRGKTVSGYSGFVMASTGKEIIVLSVPAHVTVSEATVSSLAFSWDAVEKALLYRYRLLAPDGTEVKTGSVHATTITIGGLTKSTPYKFAVQAVNGEVSSVWSAFAEAATADQEFNCALPDREEDGIARAFPGAEGGGMYTTGGRGGTVCRVTSLADDNTPGTLRHAVSQSGLRTVVFDVDGVIELKSSLVIRNGDLTIAGQTAPGDGICLKNYTLSVGADNVIIRYIRCRMGDEKGTEGDAMESRWHRNVIIDHCSMSWSTDECASFYAMENFTMQWCLLGESLRNSAHIKGTHGYGAIWGGVNASFHHNLLAHHDSRNPRFDGYTVYAPESSGTRLTNDMRSVDYRNCVVYNFSNYTAYGGEGMTMNYAGNYYKWGPGSSGGPGISFKDGASLPNSIKKRQWFFNYTEQTIPMSAYADSNCFMPDNSGLNTDNWNGFYYAGSAAEGGYRRLDSPIAIAPDGQAAKVTYHTAAKAYEQVLNFAGASLKRDAVDTRLVGDTRTGTATVTTGSNGSINGYIDSQKDVGGWPKYAQGTVPTDSDGDGMPDSWEELAGLDKTAADGNTYTLDSGKRYTNLEMYLHWLVLEITREQAAGGDYITL